MIIRRTPTALRDLDSLDEYVAEDSLPAAGKKRSTSVAVSPEVHDELVFDAPPEETQKLAAMVKHEMEQVYPLAVPLVADIGVGENWRDAK